MRKTAGGNFYFLLGGLLILLLLAPVASGLFEDVVVIGFSATLVVGVWSLARTRWAYYVGLVLAVISVVLSALELGTVLPNLVVLQTAVGFVFCMLTMMIVLREVIFARGVDTNRLAGAVSVYLLMGLNWAIVYRFMALLDPGAFSGLEAGVERSFLHLVYYSFVTLTTLGYGDIAPISPLARALAYLEAVSGVMYVATLVASLVGSFGSGEEHSSKA